MVPTLCRTCMLLLLKVSWGLGRATGSCSLDAADLFVVAAWVRLVRPDAGSACGIVSRKSGKSGKDPTLWNIHNGHLWQGYQLSREVSQVSRSGIWAITRCFQGDDITRLRPRRESLIMPLSCENSLIRAIGRSSERHSVDLRRAGRQQASGRSLKAVQPRHVASRWR
jgi:hypothetical protein